MNDYWQLKRKDNAAVMLLPFGVVGVLVGMLAGTGCPAWLLPPAALALGALLGAVNGALVAGLGLDHHQQAAQFVADVFEVAVDTRRHRHEIQRLQYRRKLAFVAPDDFKAALHTEKIFH